MQLLLFNDADMTMMQRLKVYAHENVVSLEKLKKMMKYELPPIGDAPNHRVSLQNGLLIVFSVEDQPRGKALHISISLNKKLPSLETVNFLLKEFGFKNEISGTVDNSFKDFIVWKDERPWENINVVEFI